MNMPCPGLLVALSLDNVIETSFAVSGRYHCLADIPMSVQQHHFIACCKPQYAQCMSRLFRRQFVLRQCFWGIEIPCFLHCLLLFLFRLED